MKQYLAKLIHDSISNEIFDMWMASYDLDINVKRTIGDERIVNDALTDAGLEWNGRADNGTMFFCDVLTAQILLGEVVAIVDNRERVGEVSMEQFVKNSDLVHSPAYARFYADLVADNADMETYDVLMQVLAFGEVIYG